MAKQYAHKSLLEQCYWGKLSELEQQLCAGPPLSFAFQGGT